MQVDIRQFDVASIRPDRVIAIVGKRGSGKSVLMRDLVYKTAANLPKKGYDFALAMSPILDSVRDFHSYLGQVSNKVQIEEDYNEEALTAFIRKMDELSRHAYGTVHEADVAHGLVLMRGCAANKNWFKSAEMRRLLLNGRHYHITFMFDVQYCLNIEPVFRANIDYLFALRDGSMDNAIKLWRSFFNMFPRFEDFSHDFNHCTADYGAMVADKTSHSSAIKDQVFYHKADLEVASRAMNRNPPCPIQTKTYEEVETNQGWFSYLMSFIW